MDFWRTEYDEEDFEPPNYVKRGRKAGHLLGRGAPHIPNKQEAKELRRLMQKSGESEEQVRGKVENRRKLAQAAKSPQVAGNRQRIVFIRLRRRIAASMSLPAYDPQVQAATLARVNTPATKRYAL